MEILQEEQNKKGDKRPNTATDKEQFNHPVGAKCVRSHYSNAYQKKADIFEDKSVE